MEKLFLVRVGSQEYMKGVARSILYKEKISPSEILLVSSSAPEGITATTILAELLGVPFDSFAEFRIDQRHEQNDKRASELIRLLASSNAKPVVVLVTHKEYLYSLGTVVTNFCKSLLAPSLQEFEKFCFAEKKVQILSAA